jgi:hypothetical protein
MIPAFAKRPFQVGRAVPAATLNPYYEVIVRLPTDEEPTEVPVGLVSKNYELVQHLEILQRAASILAVYELDLDHVEVSLDLTVFGERMRLGLLFPKDSKYSYTVRPGDTMGLYLEFINSVDGSLRLALRVNWLRLVCTNGLTMREVVADFSRTHLGDAVFEDFEEHLSSAMEVVEHQKLFHRWLRYRVTPDAFEEWIEKTVRRTWGLKAAVRAYHIAHRGVDVEIETMLRSVQVADIPTRDRSRVPGALTDSLSLFAISQVLAWLAGERRELQEQLDWKRQVYPMLAPLVRNDQQGALGFPPGMADDGVA